MKSKRALRRHHLARCKVLALQQTKALFAHDQEWCKQDMINRYRNRALCSCWMCGNPRRYATAMKDRLTLNERIAILDELQQLAEWDEQGIRPE